MRMTSSTAIERPHGYSQSQPDAAPAPATGLPEILYIMGTGRSGTTILEVLLANNPAIAGAGELKHIFRDGYIANRSCACGKAARDCAHWVRVLQSTGWERADWMRMAALLQRLESHAAFPWVATGLKGRELLPEYRQANEALFTAIGAAAQSRAIVDSSKYAGRALLLSRMFPEKVKILCITRSAAGLVGAFAKKNDAEQRPKGMFAAAAYYVYVLLCMRVVQVRVPRDKRLTIAFEDLMRDPQTTLRTIEAWSGHSLATSRSLIASGGLLDVGHIVTGNRLRKKGRVTFEPKPPESPELGFGARIISAALEAYRRLLGFSS